MFSLHWVSHSCTELKAVAVVGLVVGNTRPDKLIAILYSQCGDLLCVPGLSSQSLSVSHSQVLFF